MYRIHGFCRRHVSLASILSIVMSASTFAPDADSCMWSSKWILSSGLSGGWTSSKVCCHLRVYSCLGCKPRVCKLLHVVNVQLIFYNTHTRLTAHFNRFSQRAPHVSWIRPATMAAKLAERIWLMRKVVSPVGRFWAGHCGPLFMSITDKCS